jgi:hemophore-related protein
MIKPSMTKLAIAGSGVVLALSAGAGVASAVPDLGPAVNTTCNYGQLESAVNAQGPSVAAAFNQSPQLKVGLQAFLASGPAERQQIAADFASAPGVGPYLPAIQTAFDTCNNF